MLTPQKIQDLADPLESIYIHMTDALLVNIGKHITSPTWTHTAAWEIQKLSELGQLTQENAAIINEWIKQIPADIRDTMEATRAAALDSLEKQMQRAAEDGYITPPVADSTVQILQDYGQQAADHLNLVNTTMLQSSVEQYQRAVMLTVEEEARLEAQRAATQTILNEAAGNVATGVETRNVALRRAITRISDEGLTGFIDRAGRHWTPEAYVNMDIRTTVHNTAIQATRARMQDFGTQVFQVSSHAGARPGCYPYQGKFYSWDNSSGSIELGNGSVVDYAPLNSTTYGQPAGLFGINCGHYPIPIIPGVTIPHGADNIQPKAENDKAYAESQEQRALERKIREAKRVVEMAGDTATKEDKARVKELQGQMREFIERTGRTRRYDRESIGGVRLPKSPTSKTPANVNPQLTTPQIKPVTVTFGQSLQQSLGQNADEFRKVVESADPRVANTYNAYSGTLNSVTEIPGHGVYTRATRNIEWSYSTKKGKYQVLGHEFGHHVDAEIPGTNYTTKEIDALNSRVRLSFGGSRGIFRVCASSSDEFLTAMRKDRTALAGYKTNATQRKTIKDELMANRNTTTGIQDAFDGFWGTQDSKDWSFFLPWGHGNKYYNRRYNDWIKGFGLEKALKAAYTDLGFDASNQAKVKTITRDYETASELWANIQAAKTIGGDELKYMAKYFPESVKAWEEITGRI